MLPVTERINSAFCYFRNDSSHSSCFLGRTVDKYHFYSTGVRLRPRVNSQSLVDRSGHDRTHLIDPTGRHLVELKLLLQQLWVTVFEWTAYKIKWKMEGKLSTVYLKGLIMTAEWLITLVITTSHRCQLTMIVALAGWVWQNHFHATVGGVVCSLAFFPIHVAYAVSVCFVKLQRERERRR